MVRLRRSSAGSPGWSRVRHGRGFRYLDEDGRPLPPAEIDRCRELVIPPAWTSVWICPWPNGHLQAVGTDDAGRRQYLYHPEWRARRDMEKFERMEGFAASLLKHRGEARRDLGGDALDLTRVAAAAFGLLDLGMFRIGSERYAEENGSYGLTTLEKTHVSGSRQGITFAYAGKSGQDVQVTVRDDRIRAVLDALRRRRSGGDRLFAYRSGRQWRDLSAEDVNDYVKETLGNGYTAKDFRTWRGTTIAALSLAQHHSESPARRKRAIAAVMREVSEHLGNTPAVARSSYVDPRLLDLYDDGITVKGTYRRVVPGGPVARGLERDVLRLLKLK